MGSFNGISVCLHRFSMHFRRNILASIYSRSVCTNTIILITCVRPFWEVPLAKFLRFAVLFIENSKKTAGLAKLFYSFLCMSRIAFDWLLYSSNQPLPDCCKHLRIACSQFPGSKPKVSRNKSFPRHDRAGR